MTLEWDSSTTANLRRRDPQLPFLDADCPLPLAPGQALTLWCDSSSAELLSADGTIAATLQHRFQTAEITVTISGDQPATWAEFAGF